MKYKLTENKKIKMRLQWNSFETAIYPRGDEIIVWCHFRWVAGEVDDFYLSLSEIGGGEVVYQYSGIDEARILTQCEEHMHPENTNKRKQEAKY